MTNLIKVKTEELDRNASEGCLTLSVANSCECQSGDALVEQDVKCCIQMVEQSPGWLLMSSANYHMTVLSVQYQRMLVPQRKPFL